MGEKPTAEETDEFQEIMEAMESSVRAIKAIQLKPHLNSRELSLAITNLEQGLHWMRDALAIMRARELWVDG